MNEKLENKRTVNKVKQERLNSEFKQMSVDNNYIELTKKITLEFDSTVGDGLDDIKL